MLKTKEIRDKSDDELQLLVSERREAIFNKRCEAASARTDKVHDIGQLRKEIARMKTVLREREIRNEKESVQ